MKNYYSDVFETLADCFCPKEVRKSPKTSQELLKELCDCYTVDEINDSVGLRFLYDHLKIRVSNGGMNNYIPGQYVRNLLHLYLNYNYPI